MGIEMNERNIRKLIILIFGEQHMTNFFIYLTSFFWIGLYFFEIFLNSWNKRHIIETQYN